MTSKMNSQPEDILREIFKRCVDPQFPHLQPVLATEAPLLLCGVCQLWRDIVTTTSELWERLAVSIGRQGSNESQPSQQLIEIWIARSGSRPLTLVLKDMGLRSSVDMADKILQIFLPHIHRWQSVTLSLPTYPSALTHLEHIPTGASQLQIARLDFGADPVLRTTDTPQIAGLARLLATSALHTLYWPNDPSTIRFLDISWSHLTVIDLIPTWAPMSQIINIMRKAPKLRSLTVLIAEPDHVAGPIFLPDLQVLWIGAEVDIGPLFEQLTLPSLKNINLFCAASAPPVPQTAVIDLLARSGCSLHAAIFTSLHLSTPDIIRFLRMSPGLLLLEISDDGAASITDDILGLLTPGDAPCLCPHLRIIRFLDSSVSSADGLLADMVASRRTKGPTSSSLSRLVIQFSDIDLPGHAMDIHRLKRLEEDGDFRAWINELESE
ncbi:hypothetical protein C8R46DRAFT_381041 [Mycena filopes]|nr:hypothetical protein C8R46DRAFT_381041 [Mycena filopes]